MNAFSLQFNYSNQDVVGAFPTIQRAAGLSTFWAQAIPAAIVAFAVVGVARLLSTQTSPRSLAAVAAIVAVAAIALFIAIRWLRVRVVRRFDTLQPARPTRVEANDEGVEFSDDHSRLWWGWECVHGTAEAPKGLVVLVGVGGAFIPDTAFKSSTERESFIAFVRTHATSPTTS